MVKSSRLRKGLVALLTAAAFSCAQFDPPKIQECPSGMDVECEEADEEGQDYICQDNLCVPESEQWPSISEGRDGIFDVVKGGWTNSSGKIRFTDEDTHEDFVVTILSGGMAKRYGEPLSETSVLFGDNAGLDTILAYKENYIPDRIIRNHNTGTRDLMISLTPASVRPMTSHTLRDPDLTQKLTQLNSDHCIPQGCFSWSELESRRNVFSTILTYIGDIFGYSQIINTLEEGVSLGESITGEDRNKYAYRSFFCPSQWRIGASNGANISMSFFIIEPERRNYIVGPGCEETECTSTTADLVCGTDHNVYLEDNCGVRELYEACETDCDEGSCLDDLCEMLPACFDGNVRLRDSCTGSWDADIFDYCTTAEHCVDSIGCVPNDSVSGTGSYCDPCTSNLDCLEDWVCNGWEGSDIFRCFKPCESNYDCRSDFFCSDYNTCFPSTTLACNSGDVWAVDVCGDFQYLIDNCLSTESCVSGSCIPETTECAPHADTICYSEDSYWINSCGNREGIADNCTTLETCVDGTCIPETTECTSHADTICYLGNSYWVDSCGERETRADYCNTVTEECIDGACVPCVSHADTICYLGDSYWVDSCGERETRADNCTSAEECVDGACIPETTCTPHADTICYLGNPYWVDSCGERETIQDSCYTYSEECIDGTCVPVTTCTPHTSTTCYSEDSYWVDSCGTRETVADDCSSLETCLDGVCVTDSATCTPPESCNTNEPGFNLYDDFIGCSVDDLCDWFHADSSSTVADGYIILHDGESLWNFGSSLESCGSFTLETRLKMNRSDKNFRAIVGAFGIVYDSEHPGNIGIRDKHNSAVDDEGIHYFSSFDSTVWNIMKLEKQGDSDLNTNINLYVNGSFKGSVNHGYSLDFEHRLNDIIDLDSIYSPSSTGGELTIDYITVKCDD